MWPCPSVASSSRPRPRRLLSPLSTVSLEYTTTPLVLLIVLMIFADPSTPGAVLNLNLPTHKLPLCPLCFKLLRKETYPSIPMRWYIHLTVSPSGIPTVALRPRGSLVVTKGPLLSLRVGTHRMPHIKRHGSRGEIARLKRVPTSKDGRTTRAAK
ncbi:hypothetical protein GY45DRAFT_450933 [Cubamyces sp. BRFM 1775]|nr:hypothetical protein GY45DRAFT_450933 [Cubamyces sp. BRFM 1775]